MSELTASTIRQLLTALNTELGREQVVGELYLVGGAVMCLVFETRPSTRDVDALFRPVSVVRAAARRVGTEHALEGDWLNDAVKGYLSETGGFRDYLAMEHLRVFVAEPEYLLAMKCLAMRIGEEFHDLEDIRYLLRHLNIEAYDQAVTVITKYYPLDRFPQKTLYALEELLSGA